MLFKNNYLYTPWEKDFLAHAKNVKSSLDIVCPFIKLPIIKKILISLPDSIRINFRLLTRLNKQVFMQKSSDLAVFDLLLNYASKKHKISVYKLDNLHAKIYIFDNEKMYITSSNLSYSGLNSNFEIAVHINDPKEIKDVREKISNLFIPEYQIFNKDIERLSEILSESNRLFIKESLIEQTQLPEDAEEETYENVVNDSGYEEEVADNIVGTEKQNKTLEEINRYLFKRGVSEYNIIDGVSFESPKKPKTYAINPNSDEKELTTTDTKTLEEFEQYWLEKTIQDEKRIDDYISKLFGKLLNNENEKINNIKNVFIHKSWRHAYSKDEKIDSKNKYFEMIGSAVFYMLITNSLLKKIVFSEHMIQRYYVKKNYIIQNYPYGKVLSDIGCKFCLNIAELKNDFDRELFEMFLGVLCVSLPYDKFYNFYRKFLDRTNDFIYDNYFEYDSKSYLMEIAQKIEQFNPSYNVISESGPDHQKEFKAIVSIKNKKMATGIGKSKKEAEKQAAYNALIVLSKKSRLSELHKRIFEPTKKYFISPERINDLKKLNKNLPINLNDIGLLDITLTHLSYTHLHRESRSYRRLSYLGSFVDSYFKLYNMFFKNNGIINKEVLDYIIITNQLSPTRRYCQIFDKLNLKRFFRISLDSINDSIKSNTIQALIASIFIDKGYEGAKEFNLMLWKDYLDMKVDVSFDNVTKIQQIVQKTIKKPKVIDYKVLLEKGPPNNREFEVGCFIEEILYGQDKGRSIKEAKQNAAKVVLDNNDFLKKYNNDIN